MHFKLKLAAFTLFFGFMTVVVSSGLALAAEFSADVIMKGGPVPGGTGKVWVKGHKMRQEFGGQAGKMITIMDLAQGFHWVLMPQGKTYIKTQLETRSKSFKPENFMGKQQGMMEAQIKAEGTERVNGYKCIKYVITFKDKQMGTMTQWFAKKLDYPIKIIHKSAMMGEVVTELKNIKEGRVKDSLFTIPAGYREMQMPQIPQMPGSNQ